ncbi:MAG: hypothetical protein K2W96_19925, partial [Gemmataceae bacterium]|nr:hypothetical protein [Gemmataceae bacterium]
ACLTACAGVAVLGARRPGAGAWNFVVGGLLVVLLRPLLEGLGELRLETAHRIFLGVAAGVGALNYLPTRQAPAALLAAGCVGWWIAEETVPAAGLAVVPWLALLMPRGNEWQRFRDAHGGFWAARLREQFNRAAENAGGGVELGWSGPVPADQGADLLRALLKRFGPE